MLLASYLLVYATKGRFQKGINIQSPIDPTSQLLEVGTFSGFSVASHQGDTANLCKFICNHFPSHMYFLVQVFQFLLKSTPDILLIVAQVEWSTMILFCDKKGKLRIIGAHRFGETIV